MNKIIKLKRQNLLNIRSREMFLIKRIEQLHQELHQYCLQVIAFQDKDSQYQNIYLKNKISEFYFVLFYLC
jgi:hypothetical protein